MSIEKRRSFIINFTYVLIISVIAVVVIKYGLTLLAPFVIGFIFAYILQRPIRFFSRITRVDQQTVAVLTIVAFYVLLGLVFILISLSIVSWTKSFVEIMPSLYDSYLKPLIKDLFDGVESYALILDRSVFELVSEWEQQIISSLGRMVSNLSVSLMGTVSDIATFLPEFFIKFVLSIISSFFIALDYNRLTGFVLAQLSDRGREVFYQVKEYLIGTLFVCIRSYILIMSITFVELSLGFKMIGLNHAVMIALIISVFDILPVLGTGGIMIPWAIAAAVASRYTLAIEIAVIYLVITVIRNIIEPKIVGSQLGLHPVVTLASMFVGVQLLGMAGLFGFPILLSLLRYLNKNGTVNLFKDAETEAEQH